jgi:carbon monoxide dehydrogenase subunit G
MLRLSQLIIVGILFFISSSVYPQIINQSITGQGFSGEIIVDALPDQVWQVLTDVSQLAEICGYEYIGGAKTFAKAGDKAQVKVWGDVGRFMLVRMDNKSELRFNLDPENGSYICGCRWRLSESGDGTKVWFEERYTESGPQTKEELDAQVNDFNESLNKLKEKAEKK